MARSVAWLLGLALLVGGAGCGGAPVPAAPGQAQGVVLQWPAPRAPRTLLAVAPTRKVRITIQADDLVVPITKDVDIDPGATFAARITDVPRGADRIFTLRYLDGAGVPIDGLHYGGYTDIDAGLGRLVLSDRSTVYHDIWLQWIAQFKASAANPFDTLLMEEVVDETLETYQVPSPRLLDVEALATALNGATSKAPPAPKPEWVAKPGFVSVGFLDFPSGTPVAVSVNDAISAPVVSTRGEPVLVGPIAPRDQAYTLRIKPLAANAGPDLAAQDLPLVVSQANLIQKMPSNRFSRSTPGQALPVRVGGGMSHNVTGSEDALYLFGGVEQPANAGITGEALIDFCTDVWRFTRTGGWAKRNAVPASFPWFGAGVAAVDSKVYVFGGQVNGLGTDKVHVIDLGGTAAATVLPAPMTCARYNKAPTVALSEAAAALVDGRILVAGGYTSIAVNVSGTTEIKNEAFTETLAFTPGTGAFEAQPPQGLPEGTERASPASAVVGTAWYLLGGWTSTGGVTALAHRFQNNAWTAIKSMPTPRSHAAAVVVDGKIWVIGGEEIHDMPSRAVEVYDPTTDSWTLRAPLKFPRVRPAAGLVKAADGSKRIVVAGGTMGIHVEDRALPLAADAVEELTP